MARVIVEKLTKKFGDVVAVRDLDLQVEDQEFMVFLGPSGCGKTTTLRCISGLERPEGGTIRIGDTVVTNMSPAVRDIAMVFQFYALYPHMSARDNIAFPLQARRMPKDEIQRRVEEVARVLRIEHLLHRRPRQLSGGEQQRVALGRAMVRRPKVFLMDEPLTNLDAKLRSEMRAELKRLQKDLNATTVYVTHDQVEAMSMGDRIGVMKQGGIEQIGTPDEVYNHPASLFVAGFVGSPAMNFLPAEYLDGANPTLHLAGGAFALPVDAQWASAIRERATGNTFTFGIRSEDIALYTQPGADRIPSEVYVMEPLGDVNLFDLKLGQHIIKAKTLPNFRLRIGDGVWLQPDRAKMHLFDAQTERAVF
jgi:multiple sugar transport system ATP-binding protein